MANTQLSRTIGTATNGKKYTLSFWIKRSALGVEQSIVGVDSANLIELIKFGSNDKLYWYNRDNAGNAAENYTSNVFRDISAWYHLVFSYDSTEGSAANQKKLYINGVAQTWGSTAAIQADAIAGTNFATKTFYFGREGGGTSYFLNGLMSHIHYIDGTVYTASNFGSTDSTTGEWKINTSPSVTYGNNGFFILKDSNSVTDQSGNSNNFTVAGGTLTNLQDNPSNVFATINPNQNNIANLSNGNLTATTSSYQWGMSTLAVNSGKWYVEMKVTHGCMVMGIQDIGKANDRLIVNGTFWTSGSQSYHLDGFSKFTHDSYGDISSDASAYPSYGSGDIVMMALDLDNNKLAYGKNGTWYNSTNPSSGTTNMVSIDAPSSNENGNYGIVFGDTCGASDGDFEINFGNGYFGTTAISSEGTNASGIGKFEYDVPAGYTALSTKGLNL